MIIKDLESIFLVSMLLEQIAHDILQKYQACSEPEIAWVQHREKIYYCAVDRSAELPQSAVIKLIQHLFDQYVDHSFFILRERIYSNCALSEAAKGMVKIAAKRASGEIRAKDHGMTYPDEMIEVADWQKNYCQSAHIEKIDVQVPQKFTDLRQIKEALLSIKNAVGRGEILHDHNRAISAIVTDKNLHLLGWSANSNFKNKTLHAEVRLIQSYLQQQGRLLPDDTKIFVSLKPCKMCAAMIVESSQNPESLQVIYLENDPGSLAQGTMLDQLKINSLWSDELV